MPTIQVQLTDEEFSDLLTMTRQRTGVKAVKFCINGYPSMDKENDRLAKELSDLKRTHKTLQSHVSGFTAALEMLKYSVDE